MKGGVIAWFARNHVAANLLMIVIAGAGYYNMKTQMAVEVFPSFTLDRISVRTAYPGASPQDVEEAVTIRIEEALQDLASVDDTRSRSTEGSSAITLDLVSGEEPREALDDIQSRIDAISGFPDDVELPSVSLAQRRREVISVALAGELSERELRTLADKVRDALLAKGGITQVEIQSVRPYEMAVEISERRLREYGLTLAEVATAINRGSASVSAGNLRTEGGDVLLRTQGQAYSAREFGDITVLSHADGSLLKVRDIADISDGFDESQIISRFNGRSSVLIEVYRVGDQSAIEIAALTRDYVAEASAWLPAGVTLDTWRDSSVVLRARLNTLLKSAMQGGVLVIVLLTLFLRPAVALWVTIGIPVSFLGCFIILPWLGVSINIVSLFAFILVLGIVVDDAIVTGENIYTHSRRGVPGEQAAIEGTLEVATPVTFGVLTTALAFLPLAMVGGARGQIFAQIPAVVVPVLLFSLIESKFVLPSHLKNLKMRSAGEGERPGLLTRVQQWVADGLESLVRLIYKPVLNFCLNWRLLTVSVFVASLLITIAIMSSGWMRFVFFPRVQSETATASLQMPVGTPFSVTNGIVEKMELAARELKEEHRDPVSGESVILNILATAGSAGGTGGGASNMGRVRFEIVAPESRSSTVSSADLVRQWRRSIGAVPGAEALNFRAEIGRGGDPLDVQFFGQDLDQLRSVAKLTREHLATYDGVFDIVDSLSAGKRELELRLKPTAQQLGLSVTDLATQVRQGFYGVEVQRIQRDRDEVKVMVRYPAEERRSLQSLQDIRIRTADGSSVPFSEVAEVISGQGPATLYRIDRRRTVNVTADANKEATDLAAVKRGLNVYLAEQLAAYPDISYSLEGEAREQRESTDTLKYGAIAVLFGIYALLAIPFKSYSQPLVVMVVIPFGLIGAVLGHWIMGMSLSIFSMMGMLALSGVVVNDSLVLVDYINKQRQRGMSVAEAVSTAGPARFRPVLLTSITTFVGLAPLLFDQSTQAQFLIPMAISLGFGILFATGITLLLVPCVYLIGDDLGRSLRAGWRWLYGTPSSAQ